MDPLDLRAVPCASRSACRHQADGWFASATPPPSPFVGQVRCFAFAIWGISARVLACAGSAIQEPTHGSSLCLDAMVRACHCCIIDSCRLHSVELVRPLALGWPASSDPEEEGGISTVGWRNGEGEDGTVSQELSYV